VPDIFAMDQLARLYINFKSHSSLVEMDLAILPSDYFGLTYFHLAE
jgi:hypothetical protein